MKDKECKQHVCLTQKTEPRSFSSEMPLKCRSCSNIYFSSGAVSVNTALGSSIELCPSCAGKLECAACRGKVSLDDSYVSECLSCRSVSFLCPECASRSKLLTLNDDTVAGAILNMQSIYPQAFFDPGRQTGEADSGMIIFPAPGMLNKRHGFSANIPRHIFIYLNMLMPDVFGDSFEAEEEDNSDWWKKK